MYDTALQKVLVYIDAHLTDVITADELAARAGFSTFHFCRLFQWRVGYSPMEYVRSRRLAFAAHALGSGSKILDIALEYGFETHSGFSKAFRRYFGYPPEVYRHHAHSAQPQTPTLPVMNEYQIGGIVLEPKLMTWPAVKIAGYALKTTSNGAENSKSIPAFWSACMSDGRLSRLHQESFIKNHNEIGACFPEDAETGEFNYVIGLEVKDSAAIPDGYHVCELPPAQYAVFSTPPCDAEKFSASIQGVWQFIFNDWFPTSGFEYAPGCIDFELYDDRCMSQTGKVCDIYIPVVQKLK